MDLGKILSKIVAQNTSVSFHWGVVVDKRTTPRSEVDITLSGSSTVITGVRYIHSYAPQNGDVVLVLINGMDIFVLGDFA